MTTLLNHLLYSALYLVQTGVELELIEKLPLLEWLANNYKTFGRYMI